MWQWWFQLLGQVIGTYHVRCLIKKYRFWCSINKTTTYTNSAFNLLRTASCWSHVFYPASFHWCKHVRDYFFGYRVAASLNSLELLRRLEILVLQVRFNFWRGKRCKVFSRRNMVVVAPRECCILPKTKAQGIASDGIFVVSWNDRPLPTFLSRTIINNRSELQSVYFRSLSSSTVKIFFGSDLVL